MGVGQKGIPSLGWWTGSSPCPETSNTVEEIHREPKRREQEGAKKPIDDVEPAGLVSSKLREPSHPAQCDPGDKPESHAQSQ